MGTENNVSEPYDKSVWVYSSVRTISQNLGRVPFKLYKGRDSTNPLERSEIISGDLFKLINNPNPFMSFSDLVEATNIYLELYGEAFWILSDRSNQTELPKEIWTFTPKRFNEVIENGNLVGWEYDKGTGNDDDIVPFRTHEILFFRYFNPYNDIRGLAPLNAAQLSIDQDYFASETNKNFFEEGAVLSGVVEVPDELTDTAYSRFISQFEERHKGYGKAHKVALLEGGGRWRDVGVNPKDMDFVNLKKLSREEIFSAYKTNPVVLGFYSDIKSYEGIRAAHRAFWVESLVPKVKYLQNNINVNFISKLSGRSFGEFDLDAIEALRDDFDKKIQTAWLMSRMGYPLNMINKRLGLGMPPVKWGDAWWANPNLVPVDSNKPSQPQEEPDNDTPTSDNDNNSDDDNNSGSKFRGMQMIVEKRFQSKLSRFLFEQRKYVIEQLYKISDDYRLMTSSNTVDLVFPSDSNEKLRGIMKSLYTTSIKAGSEMVANEVNNIDFLFNERDYEYVINARLNVIPDEIVLTIKRQLNQALIEGVDSGDSILELVERVKKVYNFASSRAKLIAKMESVGSINDGRFTTMKRFGIDSHKWLYNGDELHKDLNGNITEIDDVFGNTDFRYPCDLSSSTSNIGCTCLTVPIKEDS